MLTQSPPLLAARYAATFAAAPCRAALPPPMARLCGLCSRALLLQARRKITRDHPRLPEITRDSVHDTLQARRKLDAHRSRRLLSSLRILPVEHSGRAARPAVPSSY